MPASVLITLSGTLYQSDGTTPITTGKTINAVVGTSTPSIHTTTSDGGGEFSFSIATSSIGSWATSSTSFGTLDPAGVAYGNGRFVAVGGGGSGLSDVMTSEDGLTWTFRSASIDLDWKWITYGEGMFVAVANNGGVMYSRDGISWSTAMTDSDPKLDSSVGIVYGNGMFIAVPAGSESFFTYSYDAINWATTSVSNMFWNSIAFGNGRFIAQSGNYGDQLFYSDNGLTWSESGVSFPYGTDCSNAYGFAYGNGRWVGLCYVTTDTYNVVVSTDNGLNWTGHTAPEDNAWGSVAYGNGYFVARSDGGTNRLMYSTNGINWTLVNIGTNTDNVWNTGTVYGEGKFVSVNMDGSDVAWYADAGFGPDTPIAIYVDGDAVDATTFMMGASSTDIANIPLYQDTVIAYNANTNAASSTTNLSNTVFYDSTNDADILYTYATGTKTLTINGAFNNEQGTAIAPYTLAVTGDFTNLATFSHNYGTTTLTGTNQTLTTTATTSFYNFTQIATTSATTTFSTAGVFATEGALTLQGHTASPLKLRSTNDGVQWTIYPTGTTSASYLDVKDSKNSSSTDITCSIGCVTSGNNTNWTFDIDSTFIGSAAAQSFYVGQATTTLEDISIIEPVDSANITAANDIRISIPTTTTSFRFDTTNNTLSYSGTASGKVANPVTYENGGATVVIPVSSNFSAEDTLVISGLEVGSFATVSTVTDNLELHLGGTVDGTPEATDTETVVVTGSLTLDEHSNTQPANQFSASDENDAVLFAFELASVGEYATVTALTIDLTAMNKIDTNRLSDLKLYRDIDSDRQVSGGDVQVGGAGALTANGPSGSIVFDEDFLASTTVELILTGDTTNLPVGIRMTMTIETESFATVGQTSGQAVSLLGSVESVTHSRLSPGSGGGRGGGSRIGVEVEGGEEQGGGGGGLGGGIGEIIRR